MDVGVRPDPGPHAPADQAAPPDDDPPGHAVDPRASTPVPPRRTRRSRRAVALVAVLLCLAAIAATGWVLLVGLGAAPDVSPTEGSFAVRAFAINRFGFAAAHLHWYDGGLAAVQVAAYETASGVLGRVASVVVAAREAMVVAALLTGVSLAVAARRLKLSVPATLAVPLLAGLPPAAVLLHRTADPANLAVLWACAALAVASGGSRRPGATVGFGCYLALAVLTSPVVLVPLVPIYGYLLWNGDIGRLRYVAKWLVAGLAVAALAALVVLIRRGSLPGVTRGLPVPPLAGLDLALLGVVALCVLAAVAVRWLRALAAGLLGTAAAVAVDADARVPLLLAAIPLAALLLAAVGDAAVAWSADRWAEHAARAGRQPGRTGRLVPAAVASAAVIAAAAAWIPASTAIRGTGGGDVPAGKALAWVLASLPSRPRLAVDDGLWADLVKAGYPPDQLAAVGGLGVGGRDWSQGWADATFVVGRDAALLTAAAGDPARQAREHSASVAAFGDGAERVQIRRVLTDPAAAARQAAQDARSRADAGAALAVNPRLRLSADGVALLRRGDVDARAEVVLAGIAAEHTLDIGAFPSVDGEDDRLPRRLIAIAAIDGRSVSPANVAVTLLQRYLDAQQAPYRPASTGMAELAGQPVLLVRYDALRQTGLLPP